METRVDTYCLAQINIARARAPLHDAQMRDFVARLEEINQVAERSPGFIWRLKADDGRSSSYVLAFDDDRMLINMSTWQSLEALREYVYRSEHAQLLRQRARWFVPMPGPALALWWVKLGSIVTLEQGRERLALLASHGPTAAAFSFKTSFGAPGVQANPRGQTAG
jgi:hypothetical protein